MVGCLSGEKDDYLVKVVVMVGKFPFGLVFDVKKLEVLLQIAGFFRRLIKIVHRQKLLFLKD